MRKIDWNTMEVVTVKELFNYTEGAYVKVEGVPTDVQARGRYSGPPYLDFSIMMDGSLACIGTEFKYTDENRVLALHLKNRENIGKIIVSGFYDPSKQFLSLVPPNIEIPDLEKFHYEKERHKPYEGTPTTVFTQPRQGLNRALDFNFLIEGTDGALPCIGKAFEYMDKKNLTLELYLRQGKRTIVDGDYRQDVGVLILKCIEIPELGIKISSLPSWKAWTLR